MANKINIKAYLVETKYRAGVYISQKFLLDNVLLKDAKMEEFFDVHKAVQEFKRRYPTCSMKDKIVLNHLYEVKNRNEFSVFWNSFLVGFCKTSCLSECIEAAEEEYEVPSSDPIVALDGYTYADAKNYVEANRRENSLKCSHLQNYRGGGIYTVYADSD